jgi:polyhydroxyalkanoate synthesis regulator phasin
MVLPSGLIAAIKRRAGERRLSITAYITELVEQDLAEGAAAATDVMPMQERLQALEERVAELEQQSL